MGSFRILFLVFFALFIRSFGVSTIFAAVGVALVVSWVFASLKYLPRLHPAYLPRPRLSGDILGELIPYSITNYTASFLTQAPLMVLPIMILYLLGPEQNAYSYVVWLVANALFMISGSISLSTFAEGSNQEELLLQNVRRALTLTMLLSIPVIILFLLAGEQILLIFGDQYAEYGFQLLTILAISALPVGLNSIYLAKIKVTKEMSTILALSLFSIASFLVLSYLLIPLHGIAGAGLAWLISQTTVSGIIIFIIWRKGNLKSFIYYRDLE
jgi:O-antigen/teichoic acid export membrane protein